MIYSFITSKEEEIKAKYGTETAVVIAKKDIPILGEVHENMIEIVAKPKRFIEPGATRTKDEVKGFIATVPIRAGEQITLNKITEPGIRTGLSKQVTPGKRAISIPVDDNTGVNRLLKPGDRIDLIATIDPPNASRGQGLTKIIAQDIPILAVGEYVTTQAPRKVEKDDVENKEIVRNLNIERNYNTITIEVDPSMALTIAYIRDNSSRIGVMLRNNDDTERTNIPAVSVADVLGNDLSRVVRTPAAAK